VSLSGDVTLLCGTTHESHFGKKTSDRDARHGSTHHENKAIKRKQIIDLLESKACLPLLN
jgi:hypothetical protein